MSDAAELVRRIRDETRARVYVACTGAGAGLLQLLWAIPGASSFLVGGSFPYATSAVDEFLGFAPDQYCSEATAVDLASTAFMHAGGGALAVGIGLTASVASLRAHRGPHRLFVASVTRTASRIYSLELDREAGSAARQSDGARADQLGLVALLDAVGLPGDALAGLAGPVQSQSADALGRERLYARPFLRSTGARETAPRRLALAFPGTFDPPHAGHFGMAEATFARTGREPVFWITGEPPHKAAVPFAELLSRARLLRGHDVLFTAGEPLYVDKARRYPGCHFIIGTDAVSRMLDARWGHAMDALVDELRRLGTRFYVVSRAVGGSLVTLHDLPDAPRDLFVEIPGRWDVSSTELRRSRPD